MTLTKFTNRARDAFEVIRWAVGIPVGLVAVWREVKRG